jgi:hypothetical protein
MSEKGLIHKSAVRRFLLEYAARNRAHRFTRVDDGVYDQLEATVRDRCRALVNAQPSCGKTIK